MEFPALYRPQCRAYQAALCRNTQTFLALCPPICVSVPKFPKDQELDEGIQGISTDEESIQGILTDQEPIKGIPTDQEPIQGMRKSK